MDLLKRLFHEEDGQGLIEYSLILAVIALVIVVFGPTIKNSISSIWGDVNDALANAAS